MSKVYGCILLSISVFLVRVSGQDTLPPMLRHRLPLTEFAAFNPVLTIDGQTLFFTQSTHPSNIGLPNQDDIWYAKANGTPLFARSLHAGTPLNDEQPNQAMSISLDGNTLYVCRRDSNQQATLMFARRQGRSWQPPEPMRIEGWDSIDVALTHWCVSLQEDYLLLSARLPETGDKEDLFIAFRKTSHLWSTPKSLGMRINSLYREASVYLAPDNHSLYFASDRPGGLGGLDLYMSQRLDDSWTNWSNPLNLGPIVNSEADESQICISETNETAYFTVKAPGIPAQIYQAEIPPNAQPARMFLCTGKVYQARTDGSLAAELCIYSIEKGEANPLYCGIRTDATGRFLLLIPQGKTVGIYARKTGFLSAGYHVVPGGIWEEEEDQEIELLGELMRREPPYRQREEDIEALQIQSRQLQNLILDMSKLRLSELQHIASLADAFSKSQQAPFANNFFLTQLRSRYEATRQQYIRDWTIDQEYTLRGDADPGDPYSLYHAPTTRIYPQTAEGRILELRDRHQRKTQQEQRATDTTPNTENASAPPCSFEDFLTDIQVHLAYSMQDTLLSSLKKELFPQTVLTLRSITPEPELDFFQEITQEYIRIMQLPQTPNAKQALDQAPKKPVQQRWQEPFADSLSAHLRPDVEQYFREKLKTPVRAFLEYDLLLFQYQKQQQKLESTLEELIQKQIQLEKNYRKRGSTIHQDAPPTEDTLVVYSNRTTPLDILMYPAKEAVSLRMDNICFQPNIAEMQPSSLVELQRLADFLKENPQIRARIDVHTNGNCTYAFAQEITQERAACLADYLIHQQSISPDRIQTRALGKQTPLSTNDSPAGRRDNQRIEVSLIPISQ